MPTEPKALVERFSKVRGDATHAQLMKVLRPVFPGNMKTARSYATPPRFNGLLDWVAGDMRWPVAAIVMNNGLGDDRRVYDVGDIARMLGRSPKTVGVVTHTGADMNSFVALLGAAHLLIENASPPQRLRNELRGVGLASAVWTSLATAGIRSIGELCSEPRAALLSVRGVNSNVIREIEAALPKGMRLAL